MRRLACLAALVLTGCWPWDFEGALAVCEDGGGNCAPRVDGGEVDAGGADAGGVDAGVMDAGGDDAGVVDAGAMDAGGDDAGVIDAGEPDAGPSDAGSSDAGAPDAGAHDAGVPDLLFVDFDDAGFDSQLGLESSSAAPYAGQSYEPGRDGGGLAFRIDYPTGSSQLKLALYDAGPSPVLYFRAWYKLSRDHNDDVELISLRNSIDETTNMGVSLGGTGGTRSAFTYRASPFHGVETTDGGTQPGRWFCLAARVARVNGGRIDYSFDGVARQPLDDAGLLAAPIDVTCFGGYVTNTLGTLTLWMDDLALSTTPLSCP